MKRFKIILVGVSVFLTAQMGFAQARPDTEIDVIWPLQSEIKKFENALRDQGIKLQNAKKDIDYLSTKNKELGNKLVSVENKLDSVENKLKEVKTTLGKTIDYVNPLGGKIDSTSVQVSENKASVDKSLHSVLVYGISGLLLAIIITIVIFYILRKRIGEGDVDLNAVKEANKKLAEQSIALDNKLAEVLERQLETDENVKNISSKAGDAETDHSLVLSIANEIMRIEQNLSFMDPKTKGVSQLRNRAAAITASLTAKGYEVPNLINTEYKEGMNYEAVMEEDEDMEPGVMRIKRVTQPCVMYQGKMIQPAKVVVAYNPEGAE